MHVALILLYKVSVCEQQTGSIMMFSLKGNDALLHFKNELKFHPVLCILFVHVMS